MGFKRVQSSLLVKTAGQIHHADVALVSNCRLAMEYQECVSPAGAALNNCLEKQEAI